MPTLPDLDITFQDHLLPAITAGTYRVDIRHVLKDANGDIDGPDGSPDKLPATSEEFEVRAAQFVLDPSSVHAVFPAPKASGDYTLVLPHITLNRPSLPWEREPKWSRVEARAPWVALMVFREGELPEDPDALGLTASRTVAQLCRPAESGVLGPAITGLPTETEAGTCRTIDVPVPLFRRLIPTEDELYYLAHVRKVAKRTRRFEGEVLTEGDYAVLTANRFPRTGGAYTAHLVSLEGHDKPLAGTIPGGTTHLRLCALWSWSFTSDPDARFDAPGLLKNLIAPSLSDDPDRLTLRLEPQPTGTAHAEDTYVTERLKLGYVPVPHRVLSGELGYAWYRGPCTPITAPEVPVAPGEHTTADHLLIYEEEHGLFDVSYASAWTLGRAIALADPDYAADVTRARRELANQAAAMMALAADPARSARAAAVDEAVPRPGLEWLHTLAETPLASALAAPPVDPVDVPRAVPRIPLTRAEARATLTTKAAQGALRAAADQHTASMPDWLDRLGLLRGVPFHYLVPHPGMLPDESLRVFAIDPSWISALVDGAASVGIHTSLDQRLNATLRAATTARTTGARPAAGMLLRSQLVPAWPAMTITASRAGTDLAELRRTHLAPDTLLVLFDDVPDTLSLREPGQGIHFGIDNGGLIGLRQLTPDTTPPLGATLPGRTFPTTGTVFSRFLRSGGEEVLSLLGSTGMVPALAQALGKTALRPGELALELVNAPLEQLLLPGHEEPTHE
ncbi:hypothetical protein ACFVJH_33840 [Streptomyces decoyicus]|uniref:hypothetical protein n=1 Tax=Streptomyces decoyicus TaxID=249567 RepID=UPI003632245C